MGITGLLPFVKNSCRPASVKDFSGATVAIDAYSWLHKGAFACAEKLVKGEKTDGYVFYCLKLLNMLIDAGVTPIMVFDGCNLASKAITEKKRRENREKTRQRGKELLCEGKVKEARECFQRCVDVTPEMAKEVIQACRRKSIDCIVAPYEADAQLAYLAKAGIAQLIITEDSDLILFGCSKILFKMDGCGGGLLYEKENLPKSLGTNASKFSFEKFRYMCILSGCDYLPSLPGIGLVKACKFFSLTTITDLSVVLSKLPSYLKMPKLVVPDEYKESFIKANNTFLYQLAYCPKEKRLVPLNPYPEGVTPEEMEYAGKYLDDELAYQLAIGNINVKNFKEFECTDFGNSPSDFNENTSVIWSFGGSSKKISALKKETAFKFNTPKRAIENIQERKFVEIVEIETPDCSDEDIFSQYSTVEAKKSKTSDPYEEDPIMSCSNISDELISTPLEESLIENSPVEFSASLNKIVKSRFFSSQSSTASSSGISSLSSSFDSRGEDFLCNAKVTESSTLTPCTNDESKSPSIKLDTPTVDNKENIMHRFAKKKSVETSPHSKSSCDNMTHSTPKQETVSLLDILSEESSSVTSTLSSVHKSAKILSQTDSASKIKPKNLFSKRDSSKNLITTRIHDFKWTKESVAKANTSLGSDGNSPNQSFEDYPEKIVGTKSPLKEISPYFVNNADDPDQCMVYSEKSESVISVENDCDDPEIVEISDTGNNLKSHQSSLKRSSLKTDKPTKCRTIGLSKKRKSGGTIPRKETLLNFNFTRKSNSVATT